MCHTGSPDGVRQGHSHRRAPLVPGVRSKSWESVMTGLRSPAACYHEAVVCSSVALYPDHVGGPGMKASRMDDYMQMSGHSYSPVRGILGGYCTHEVCCWLVAVEGVTQREETREGQSRSLQKSWGGQEALWVVVRFSCHPLPPLHRCGNSPTHHHQYCGKSMSYLNKQRTFKITDSLPIHNLYGLWPGGVEVEFVA